MIVKRLANTTRIVSKPFDSVVVVAHTHGCDLQDDIRLERDRKGNCLYKKVGEFNISEYVQSFKTGCALSAILDRITFLPTKEKVGYLQQQEGFSANLTNFPTDASEAWLMMRDVFQRYPEVVKRVHAGESLDTILREKFAAAMPANDNKEVNDNGTV